jgi:hypothetical protein
MKVRRQIRLIALAVPLALVFSIAAWAPSAWSQDNKKTEPAQVAKPYHGNVKTKKFHRHGCRYYSCRSCLANFKNREEAIKSGYYPCKVCKP